MRKGLSKSVGLVGDSYWDVFSLEDSRDFRFSRSEMNGIFEVVPLLCLYLGVPLVFLQVFSFIYAALWISVEAENVVAVMFVGRYLRCTSLLYTAPFVADEIGL